ncbi:MAG: hypothetical protein ACNS62_19450 [Candidatus Cyclobacteriaceae bacterium M3_2C_046]
MNRRQLLIQLGKGSLALSFAPFMAPDSAQCKAKPKEINVTNFDTLKNSLFAYAQKRSGISAGGMAIFAMLNQLDYARQKTDLSYIDQQLGNGLFPAAAGGFKLYPEMFYTMHELFIDQRDSMSGSVHAWKRPPHPLRYLHPLVERSELVVNWIESLGWDDPWSAGNLDMDLGYALAFEWKMMGNSKAQDALQVWFDWHDNNFDPETCYWDPQNSGNLYRMMAGAMHQMGIYFMFNHELPYPENAIDATLKTQTRTGLFTPHYFSHNSSDIDGVFIIANVYNKYQVREKEVKESLERAFEANLKCFHPTGGAVNRLGVDQEADWWSTWCRTEITGLCARVLGINDFNGPWKFQQKHPFISEDGGKSLPDWESEDWMAAAGWKK